MLTSSSTGIRTSRSTSMSSTSDSCEETSSRMSKRWSGANAEASTPTKAAIRWTSRCSSACRVGNWPRLSITSRVTCLRRGGRLEAVSRLGQNQTRWWRKTRPPGRWVACLRMAVRPGWSGGRARPWAGSDGAEARRHSQQRAKGGVRMVERQHRGGRACCGRDDSCRRSAPGCGRDGSTGRGARRSAVQSRRSRSIR